MNLNKLISSVLAFGDEDAADFNTNAYSLKEVSKLLNDPDQFLDLETGGFITVKVEHHPDLPIDRIVVRYFDENFRKAQQTILTAVDIVKAIAHERIAQLVREKRLPVLRPGSGLVDYAKFSDIKIAISDDQKVVYIGGLMAFNQVGAATGFLLQLDQKFNIKAAYISTKPYHQLDSITMSRKVVVMNYVRFDSQRNYISSTDVVHFVNHTDRLIPAD